MAENKMEALAKLLGVEREEEFRLSTRNDCKYKLTRNGIWCCFNDNDWVGAALPGSVFSGTTEIYKSILTKKEKEYLSSVIKPFRDRVSSISKYGPLEYITISLDGDDFVILPNFEEDTMYKGMTLGKKYTLEELEL